MDDRTRRKILKLRKKGYAPKGIAMAVGCTQEEVQAVVYGRPKQEEVTREELDRHAERMIREGCDPDVVRANFG